MSRRGRPNKPTQLKILEGNRGHRPLNDEEPQPAAGAPRCPHWLDVEAKAEWKRIVPELATLGLLTLVDRAAIAAYCQAWAEFRWATETLRADGRTLRVGGQLVDKGKGEPPEWLGSQVQPHPAVAQQRSAWAAVRAFAGLFGLDPSSRSRIKVPPAPEQDEFEAWASKEQHA